MSKRKTVVVSPTSPDTLGLPIPIKEALANAWAVVQNSEVYKEGVKVRSRPVRGEDISYHRYEIAIATDNVIKSKEYQEFRWLLKMSNE